MYVQPASRPALLPPPLSQDVSKKCLVLDLDETLVHSSFKPISKPDYIIPVEIEEVCVCVGVCVRARVQRSHVRVAPARSRQRQSFLSTLLHRVAENSSVETPCSPRDGACVAGCAPRVRSQKAILRHLPARREQVLRDCCVHCVLVKVCEPAAGQAGHRQSDSQQTIQGALCVSHGM